MAGSPWTNQVVSLIVLTEATGGFSGLFGYSPTPGAGNLIFSIAAANGTDPYGNAYLGGVTSYSGSTDTSISGGVVNLSGAGGYQAAQLGPSGAGESFLSSGLVTSGDIGAEIDLQSRGSAGQSTITLSAALVNVIVNLTVNGFLTVNSGASITGGLTVDTINGSSSTGSGSNGGVTSGPSGTVNAFPAAGPNHTHAEFHTHPI